MELAGKSRARRYRDMLARGEKPPHFTDFTHQTPQPDTEKYGHRVIKKSLAKSVSSEDFSTN